MGYQERDWEIVDYQLYNLQGMTFRGPKPNLLEEKKYFSCLGAAQTFGCFCDRPYPKILEEKINFQSLNLGFAGAGPDYFIQRPALIELINNGRFAIIQVMSGRSESNSLFYSGGQEYLTRRSDGIKIGAGQAYQQLLKKYPQDYVHQIVEETRQNWIMNYQKLLQLISIPKILFWFSVRNPYYQEKYDNVHRLFSHFPQLVNYSMIQRIKQYSDAYVESISRRGFPQLLISRFTHKPTYIDLAAARKDLEDCKKHLFNNYYPSPEMQIDAANSLEKVCKKYLSLIKS